MVIASYAASRRGLLMYMAASGPIVGLVTGLIALLIAMRSAKGVVFFVVFTGMGAFFTYYFGFRLIWLVELTSVELRWRHALGGGAAPLSAVRSIRCSEVSRRGGTVDVATVEFTSRRPVKFLASQPGLTEFLAKLRDAAPQVPVGPPRRTS